MATGGEVRPEERDPEATEAGAPPAGADWKVQEIPLRKIVPHPLLPAREGGGEALALLAQSISRFGVICPVIVKRAGGRFQLVAGRRRVEACRQLGLKTVPAVVRDLTDEQVLEVALLENSHREDLSEIEEVEAFRKLTYEFPGASLEDLASRFGLDLAEIRRKMWLAELHPLVKEALYLEVLTEEHAEALRGIVDRERLLALVKRVYTEDLSPEALRALVEAKVA
ncbi:MAG: ParB/RepB/Spo0J family partition protein [Planctomycetales bacterium]|nr:ParB/RepB/Spo0J family partition protein [Planctomycetales bacterium]